MNDKMKMDIRLEIIEKLYEGDERLAERIRTEWPDLLNELESMQSMKATLDARPSRRPDAATFDAVLRAAADASAGRPSEDAHLGGRQDRPPRARRALYLRSAGVATAVLTVLIAVTIVLQTDLLDGSLPIAAEKSVAEQSERAPASAANRSEPDATGQSQPEPAGTEQHRSERDAASPNEFEDAGTAQHLREREGTDPYRADNYQAPSGGAAPTAAGFVESSGLAYRTFAAGREMRHRPSDILPVGMRPIEAAGYSGPLDASGQTIDEDLSWDQASVVMEMFQQIEKIGEGVARGWEPPSVPLEMMPASREGRASGLQPAGERRTP